MNIAKKREEQKTKTVAYNMHHFVRFLCVFHHKV